MLGALFKRGPIREPGSTGFLKLTWRQRPEAVGPHRIRDLMLGQWEAREGLKFLQ